MSGSQPRQHTVYPFSAIVGQEELKLALMLNAVDPRIGGVLIRGDKGSAKSTAVRAFVRLFPPIRAVEGCPYACDPSSVEACEACAARLATGTPAPARARAVSLVELPLGADIDRVVGTIDLDRALAGDGVTFQPGLLAAANRGVLYADEVNLLPDHLIDVLLDAAAMGTNYVEREGISVSHPARFVLAGTMNPEEGDLRPQLLDRFGLAVRVEAPLAVADRAAILRRQEAFERDPEQFAAGWAAEEQRLRDRLADARNRVGGVRADDAIVELVARLCLEAGAEGLRADLTILRAAKARAALDGRDTVTRDDLLAVAPLALGHRLRRQPFDDAARAEEHLREVLDAFAGDHDDDPGDGDDGGEPPPPPRSGPPVPDAQQAQPPWLPPPPERPARDQVTAPGAIPDVRLPAPPPPGRVPRAAAGRRLRDAAPGAAARPIATVRPGQRPHARHLAPAATLRATALHQAARRPGAVPARLVVTRDDLRYRVKAGKAGALILFAVDTSGSVGARDRIAAVKGAVLALLVDAYQKRDVVGLVAFRGAAATLVLQPTSSTERATRLLRRLPAGGRTPLAHALDLCDRVFAREQRRSGRQGWLVLLTDGRANVSFAGGDPRTEALVAARQLRARGVRALVFDTERGPVGGGFTVGLGAALDAPVIPLPEASAPRIRRAVRGLAHPGA